VITLYTKTEGPENDTTATLCGDRLKDALTAAVGMFETTTAFTADTFVDTIDPVTGVITGSDDYAGFVIAGTQGTGYMPPANQVCVTWITAAIVNGRRVRGRTFLGPLSSGQMDSTGTPTGPALTHAAAFATAWTDAGLTDTSTCVWHRPVGGTGGSDHTILTGSVRDKFAVLRSRRD
jgi:hypothetical protein